jgi:flagellar protein FliO/FliZ
MDLANTLTSGFALLFVLCLIGLISLLFRKYGQGINLQLPKGEKRRLKVKEVLPIDARRKIVLIGKDDKEYLIAFADNEIEVIEE